DRARLYESVALSSRGVRRAARSMRSTQVLARAVRERLGPMSEEGAKVTCSPHPKAGAARNRRGGAFRQAATPARPGVLYARCAVRERLAQPQPCGIGCSVWGGCVDGLTASDTTAAWPPRQAGVHPQRLSGQSLQPGVLITPVGSGLAGTRHPTSAGELR